MFNIVNIATILSINEELCKEMCFSVSRWIGCINMLNKKKSLHDQVVNNKYVNNQPAVLKLCNSHIFVIVFFVFCKLGLRIADIYRFRMKELILCLLFFSYQNINWTDSKKKCRHSVLKNTTGKFLKQK